MRAHLRIRATARPKLRGVQIIAVTVTMAIVVTVSVSAAPAAAAKRNGAGDFPVMVRSEQGEVTIPSKPRRIVSLSASLTEMLYAVGAGKQVIAVDKFSNFPTGTPVTDLSGLRPNLEAIASRNPDLVVLANDRDNVARSLGLLSIPTLVLPSAKSLDDVYREMKVLGVATGHVQQAASVVREVRQDLETIVESAPVRSRRMRYYYELSGAQHSATSGTFIGELLALLGLRSIADDVGGAAGAFPQLSSEFVVHANPDLIFLAHTDGTPQDAAAVAARPGWSQLRAVRNGRVIALDLDVSSRWGPRIVELLRAVARATQNPRAG